MQVVTIGQKIWGANVQPGFFDICLMTTYFIVIYLIIKLIENKNRLKNPAYNYFSIGFLIKVFMSQAICIVYTYVYSGGDSTAYYVSAEKMGELAFDNSYGYFRILMGSIGYENFSEYGLPTWFDWPFRFDDQSSWVVVRLTSLFTIIGFKNYFTTSLLLSIFSYFGTWKLFLLLNRLYPGKSKQLAIAFLFIPSVAFWGSGILKDTYTYSAICWFMFCFYKIFIDRSKFASNLIGLFIAIYIIIIIKPYILVALLPGCFLWFSHSWYMRGKTGFMRFATLPLILVIALFVNIFIISTVRKNLGEYGTIEGILNKAVATQMDLKNDFYGGESFNIGEFDANIGSVIAKVPEGLIAGLYRPFLWEAKNPLMLLSAIENLFLLILLFYVLIKISLKKSIKIVIANPYLFFTLSFSLFLAFSIGLTSSNFGSLVRYKIPIIPFYVSGLFLLIGIAKDKKNEKKLNDKNLL
ncbi:MAG: hypothetical protein V2A54_15100 [Bacteroidota bacterium]